MPAVTPSFLFDLESNMRVITSRQYTRLNSNVWWNKIAKRMDSKSKKERITWQLETARIERTNKGGGQVPFEDMVAQTTEYENENAAAGLKVKKEQIEDLDGNGIQLATSWSQQIGAYAAYWPQKMLAKAIRDNGTTYDGKAFFATDHPLNPFDSAAGTFANKFTGAVSGSYPGALPINGDLDDAIDNIAKALAYITGAIKMPSGEDPRMLRLAGIVVPPTLSARAQELTKAKFIAKVAGSGAGSSDVEAVVRNFGLGEPITAPELGGAFSGGSDTSYYLLCEDIISDDLGAFAYVDREPFSVVYHGPQTDAELARKRELQWTTEGRNTVGAGHPFLLFRCDAT